MKSPLRGFSTTLAFTVLMLGFLINLASTAAVDDCLVPCNEIVSGGPPKDGIPAIDSPKFITSEEFEDLYIANYLNELYVVGVVVNGVARAYPRDILNWHEICNDEIDGSPFSVTFCPLTGSAIAYNTTSIGGSTLGTTGRLYENNLVFYTRTTDDWYSQMLGVIIVGESIGKNLPQMPVVETTWRTWKTLHPDTQVLSRETGHFRTYDSTPYPGYRNLGSIWFPTTYDVSAAPYNLYHQKHLTLVLNIGTMTYLYPYFELSKSPVVNHRQNGSETSIVIVYDSNNDLAIPFNTSIDSPLVIESFLTFSQANIADYDNSDTMGLPVFRDNQTGSVWNFNGLAFRGPLQGTRLSQVPAYSAFWFAATSFYSEVTVFRTESYVYFDGPVENFSTANDLPGGNSFNTRGLSLILAIPGFVLLIAVLKLKKRTNQKE
ncbi:MAG: DUF3179 domain-containing protein [Candidatus Heimdallarchaeota archaeon]